MLFSALYDGNGDRVFAVTNKENTGNWHDDGNNGSWQPLSGENLYDDGKWTGDTGNGNDGSWNPNKYDDGSWKPEKYNSVSYSNGKLQTYDQQMASRAVSTVTKIKYNEKLVNDIMLIPNGVNEWNRERYELTGYINDTNTQVLMEFGFGGTIGNVYDYGVQRNSFTNAGKTSYYTYDGRGSVSDVLNSNGDVQLTYAYTEFGKTTTFFSEYVDNPYRYNAECVDYVPGIPDFQYLRARYYAPHEGRFIQQDTLFGDVMVPLSQNLYAYTMNNPLGFIDPSGHYNIPLSIEMAGPEAVRSYLIGTGQKKKPAEEKKEVADEKNGNQEVLTEYEKRMLEIYNSGKLQLSEKTYFEQHVLPIAKIERLEKERKSLVKEYSIASNVRRKEIVKRLNVIDPPNSLVSKSQMEIVGNLSMTILGDNKSGWSTINLTDLNNVLYEFNISNPNELSMFIANSSAETHFGDWKVEIGMQGKYRGAGSFQLTGEKMYRSFSNYLDEKNNMKSGEVFDENIMILGAEHVAENYFWESGAYVWTSVSDGHSTPQGHSKLGFNSVINQLFSGNHANKNPHPGDNYKIKEGIYNEIKDLFN